MRHSREAPRRSSSAAPLLGPQSDGIEPGGPELALDIPGVQCRVVRTLYKSPLLQSLQSNLSLQHLSQRTEAAYVY
jgi:hypothetical protein